MKKAAADLLLEQSQPLLMPWVELLLRQGVTYPQLAATLKQVFFDAAQAELRRTGQRQTDSAISVLSGLHRKEVRALGSAGPRAAGPAVPLSSQIVTRWLADARYRDRRNKPRDLPRHGPGDSFESLASSLSKDVHPRTALEELVRLGAVTLQGDMVCINGAAFVPKQGFADMVALLCASVADHIAAGAHNLEAPDAGPRFLEQSVFAASLTPESARRLGELAREIWAVAFQRMVAEASARVDHDRERPDATHRARFGVFFYADTDPQAPDGA
ncbi:DUF6502 family protein [Caenimonas terrae]|uniref:DUF6502 family protein n=1 Tax=Caenimonas terrae TaxID=696074 RepID=A0ABW0NAM7_9BURK